MKKENTGVCNEIISRCRLAVVSSPFHEKSHEIAIEEEANIRTRGQEQFGNGYRAYLEDQKSQFKWESMIALLAVQLEIVDVVNKKS